MMPARTRPWLPQAHNALTMAAAVASALAVAPCPADSLPATAEEANVRGGLPRVASRLAAGEDVGIAYIGGSITEQDGYRVYSADWFRQQYPSASVHEINAAIGGTPSYLGAFRFGQDVLSRSPDLVVVEFAVNDLVQSATETQRSMEGMVRQLRSEQPDADVLFVYTARDTMFDELQAGVNPGPVEAMERIAEHYRVPSINMAYEAAQMESRGELVIRGSLPAGDPLDPDQPIVFSADGVHPYVETGHVLYQQALERNLPAMLAGGAGPANPVSPYRADHRENATIVPFSAATLAGPWEQLDPATSDTAADFEAFMPELFHADTPGATASVRFEGTDAGLYLLRSPDSSQINARLDLGESFTEVVFDKFTVRERISWLDLASDLPDAEHELWIELDDEEPDRYNILAPNRRDRYDPVTFSGTNLYAAGFLIDGLVHPIPSPATTPVAIAATLFFGARPRDNRCRRYRGAAWGVRP